VLDKSKIKLNAHKEKFDTFSFHFLVLQLLILERNLKRDDTWGFWRL